jgi:hypothetical protein
VSHGDLLDLTFSLASHPIELRAEPSFDYHNV